MTITKVGIWHLTLINFFFLTSLWICAIASFPFNVVFIVSCK
jgi:hypothetical protein